ncbi:hypothetical protein SCLCIDRAFT_129464, partial [Scleroderma citrinum Foug A]
DLPCWLADEDVHKGIKLMLEVDCCCNGSRLSKEQSILQEWFAIEWLSIKATLEDAGECRCYFYFVVSQ